MNPKLEKIGEGYTRVCYRHKRWVYKFPLGSISENHENKTEATIYKRTKGFDGTHYFAKCKLLKSGVLIMEFLENLHGLDEKPYNRPDNLPGWCSNFDSCQVGYDRKGQIKAYDYGNWYDEAIK